MIDDRLDRANLFKTFAKAFFQKRGLLATFMAKSSMHYPGQSGHFHFSLLDGRGEGDAVGENRFLAAPGARRLLGDEFVEHFAMSRRWESREYERHVNRRQLERYFEII